MKREYFTMAGFLKKINKYFDVNYLLYLFKSKEPVKHLLSSFE